MQAVALVMEMREPSLRAWHWRPVSILVHFINELVPWSPRSFLSCVSSRVVVLKSELAPRWSMGIGLRLGPTFTTLMRRLSHAPRYGTVVQKVKFLRNGN